MGIRVLVTGTPGCGKSVIIEKLLSAEVVADKLNIGQYAREHGFVESHNEEFDADYLNEDDLLDKLIPSLRKHTATALAVEHHSPSLFDPIEEDGDRLNGLFDLIVVLRCEPSVHYTRMETRGYDVNKMIENNAAEVGSVCLDESERLKNAGVGVAVLELDNSTEDQLDRNVERIAATVRGIGKPKAQEKAEEEEEEYDEDEDYPSSSEPESSDDDYVESD
ncbi:Adenylate kinase isoenzyme 6 [Carpediemonas membranifera]|uniref:Adenylate kinase isoenzyme 6 homolog n=1 Tax=Carpediemonas membranifera TaxID=201153 RepID=A0A8J6B521_9EUKA|nr:Adenylate kinase isoenzyme 6 [Carpediemonas membranifera]|eukprot:KAG9393032.1 Adenylate kinase isoenzyme 6 [Carpediemonas membranifera]